MPTIQDRVFLDQISISGYRSCEKTTFCPCPNLSALIGINGAGKTNILNAISLLSPREIRPYRGRKKDASAIETVITAWFIFRKRRIGLKLRLLLSSDSSGNDEIISYQEEWNLSPFLKYKNWVGGLFSLLFSEDSSHHLNISRHMYIRRYERHLSQKGKKALDAIFQLKPKKYNDLMSTIRAINYFRRSIKYYSASRFTDPTRCPTNFEVNSQDRLEPQYRGAGAHHVQFLFNLYSLKQKNPNLYKEYEDYISKPRLGLISRLSWKIVSLSSNTAEVKSGGKLSRGRQYKTLIIPKIQIGSSHITFNQLSEGTFKTLALIFYIMTESSSCLLIEEPEVCVHHGLLDRIIGTIDAHSQYKQIIFSTHSDLVLDKIPQSSVFVVEKKKAATRVSNLSKWLGKKEVTALNVYLKEVGTLGEYWRSGGFSA
ncbi:MAG: AAA family ATPase [Bdellovibrionales bacterium]